jgi:hypothetical protein
MGSSPDRFKETARTRRVKLALLRPDPANRELREAAIVAIVEGFDFGKWTPPIVREDGNGGHVLIEGHHHVEAACRVPQVGPDREVICYVYPPILDDARVGDMYLGISSRVAHTPTEKFKARLRKGDASAVATAGVITRAGFKGIANHPCEGWIHTVPACEWVLRGGGHKSKRMCEDELLATLETISQLWGDAPEALSPSIVKGLGLFFLRFPAVPVKELVRKMEADSSYVSAKEFRSRATMVASALKQQVYMATRKMVRDSYNRGRSSGSLPEF